MSQTLHETPVNIATSIGLVGGSNMSSSIALTLGCLLNISKGEKIEKPILQVIAIKGNEEQVPNQRIRLILSDGSFYQHATLTTQVKSLVTQGKLKKGSLVELAQYTTNSVKSKTIIVIIALTVVAEQFAKIGNPKAIEPALEDNQGDNEETKTNTGLNADDANPHHMKEENDDFQFKSEAPQREQPRQQLQQPRQQLQQPPPQRQQQQQQQPRKIPFNGPKASSSSTLHRQPLKNTSSRMIPIHGAKNVSPFNEDQLGIFPIEGLNPYQHKWKIRARVVAKGEIRSWSTDRGNGKLFSVDLVDESGEMRATAFNSFVDKFFSLLEVGKVYYISRASIKNANKKYSSMKNDYEMQLDNNTEISICNEDLHKVPEIKYNFVSIDKIEHCEPTNIIDVIGIATNIESASTITTKTTLKEILKRNITIMDETGYDIKCTLWGSQAASVDESLENPVILIKGAKVGDFGGRSLSTTPSSAIIFNPDMEGAHRLKGWHQKAQNTVQPKSLTSAQFSGGIYPRKNISAITSEKLGFNDKPDLLSVKATVMSFPKDSEKFAYPACPKCGKKVTQSDAKWFCPNSQCNEETDQPEFKYTLSLSVADMSGLQWTRAFGGVGDIIMCVPAKDLMDWKNDQIQYFEYVLQEALVRDYIFNLRVKNETFGNEDNQIQKVNVTITQATPLDYVNESKKLLAEIKNYSNNY